jgi:MerR family copper efflux transcriptional regulator
VRRVRFTKRAQEIGLSLRLDGPCSEVRSLAEANLRDIETRIRTLSAMKQILQRLTEECPGCGPASECTILENIDSTEVLV